MTPETRAALDELDPQLRRLESLIENFEQVLASARDLRRQLLAADRAVGYWERRTAESEALLAEVRAEAGR